MNQLRPNLAETARPRSERRVLAEVRDLAVRLGGRTVLDGVELEVRPGEIVTLIGPNGSGKTTLVRTLLGLVQPSRGTARLGDGVRVGYVPQRFAVDPVLPLKVRRLMTLTHPASRAEIAAALERTGVGHLADADVGGLSGGETQRVLLARALLRRPDLLVLDEPVQGVDHAGEAALYELIARLRDEEGLGVLMVSHDLHVVMAATDQVLCLNGHVCCAGVPAEISAHPEFLRLFGPQVASTLAVYRHRHDHEHDIAGAVVGDTIGDGHDHHHHGHEHHHAHGDHHDHSRGH
ncbi:MAG: zinc ABC transporter ATP-binding protein ZnuC [Pseudomonadota bacterium]|nr:zinc ABC transporter ATP-binding protein ZnuC [Pseudomonadota bacterium]